MTYTTLDNIVRNILQRKQYPIHWYFQTLVNAKDILRELHFDVLRCINSTKLTVGVDNTADLPDDYVDYTRIGVQVGQNIRPLLQMDSLIAQDNTQVGVAETGDNTDNKSNSIIYGFPMASGLTWGTMLTNSYGEVTGRVFGYGAGTQPDTFRVLREQNKILFNRSINAGSQIILEYIGDGSSCDNATQVDPYAQACIEAYCLWQFAEQNRTSNIGDKQYLKTQYEHQLRILKGRKNDWTIPDIKRLIQKHHVLSIR